MIKKLLWIFGVCVCLTSENFLFTADIGDMKESSLKVIVPEGVVFCVNPDDPNHILWQQKVDIDFSCDIISNFCYFMLAW